MVIRKAIPKPTLRAITVLVCILLDVGRVTYMGVVIVWVGPDQEWSSSANRKAASSLLVICTRLRTSWVTASDGNLTHPLAARRVIDRRESCSLESGRHLSVGLMYCETREGAHQAVKARHLEVKLADLQWHHLNGFYT
jgi:hypothetical protein